MCLLFFYVNNEAKEHEFRLILVNNRDEYWNRPTKPAEEWAAESCISGFDQELGREGGTWFGASKSGRVASLVNIFLPQDLTKRGRGFLVRDFLVTPDDIDVYAKRVADENDSYSGFTLTLIDLGLQSGSCRVYLVTNDRLSETPILQVQTTTPVGNSPLKCPWCKMIVGKEKFMETVRGLGQDVSTKEKLVDSLFELMFDRTKCVPDPQLESQAQTCGWSQTSIKTISSIFVWNPERQYGTRTTTVLLVDGKGNCDYREKTLETPVSTCQPTWSTKSFTFHLQPPSTI